MARGVEAIEKYPIPKTIREVQSFLGFCSYFRKFIKGFSILTKPLYELIQAFHTLEAKFTSARILSTYNPQDKTELHCDASALGFGAVLMQRKWDGNFHLIFYYYKITTELEMRNCSFELETLAVIYALRRFRVYVIGLRFKKVTDCNALKLTLAKQDVILKYQDRQPSFRVTTMISSIMRERG